MTIMINDLALLNAWLIKIMSEIVFLENRRDCVLLT